MRRTVRCRSVGLDRTGRAAKRHELPIADLAIPSCHSLCRQADTVFGCASFETTKPGGYVLVRDTTCRLFGHHLLKCDGAFAPDHMFGF